MGYNTGSMPRNDKKWYCSMLEDLLLLQIIESQNVERSTEKNQ